MNVNSRLFRGGLYVWPMLALTIGCSSLQLPEQTTENITQERKQRNEEAARQFEMKRDFAEFQAALAHWNQRDVQGCEESLQRLLRRNPKHRDAQLLLTEICLTENRPQEALQQIERALLDHPDDAQVRYTAGLVLDATGQHGAALAYYERAARLEPANELYVLGYQTAIEAARRVQPLPPPAQPATPSSAPAFPVGHAVYQGNDTTSQADFAALLVDDTARLSTSVRRASHTEPAAGADLSAGADSFGGADSANAAEKKKILDLIRRGHAALAKGSREDASSFFKQAIALRPDNPQIPIFGAVTSLRHNQPDLAIELLTPARHRFSDSARIFRTLGAAYHRLGDYRSSQVALQQALSLDNSNALTYFLLGCTLEKLGQFESAQAHLRQARAIDPRYAVRR